MAKRGKKRAKDKSTKANSKLGKKIIFGVLILLLVLIVIFILISVFSGSKTPCEKANGICSSTSCPSGYERSSMECKKGSVCCTKIPEKSACETYGNSCYNGSCPSNSLQVNMNCTKNTDVCCRNLSSYKSPCENYGNICFKSILPEPNCPVGYAQVDLGCILGEICCKKILTPCELNDYSCKDSCSAIEEISSYNCTVGKECCRYKIETRDECEHEGYLCHYSSCKTGFEKAGICGDDYLCCKRETNPNKLFVYGFVRLKQGNCMPPINTNLCKTDELDTTVGIFMPVSQFDLEGLYYRPTIEPVQSQRTIKNEIIGYYEIDLPAGTYSIFAKDPMGGLDYYCNQFSSDGKACTFTIANSSLRMDITIDHSTQ